jgi:hypothetical protein
MVVIEVEVPQFCQLLYSIDWTVKLVVVDANKRDHSEQLEWVDRALKLVAVQGDKTE